MGMTIEQAQTLSEMRVKFLRNTEQGLPPETGFTEEELSAGLAMIRQSRTATAANQAEKAAKKGKKVKEAGPKIDASKFFGAGIDLDDDEEEESAAPTTGTAKDFGVGLD